MSTSVCPSESQARTIPSHLADDDLVTVVVVELEAPWRPKSPFDIPRTPRPVGGVPIRRVPLSEAVENNREAMRTRVRHWWVITELMALGHHDAADGNRDTDRRNISEEAVAELVKISDETADTVQNKAEQLAAERSGPEYRVEVEDVQAAAKTILRGDQEPTRSIPTVQAFDAIEEAQDLPFRVTDQAGADLPATITVYASTPLFAIEYCGDLAVRQIVPEHDLADVARRLRLERPQAVTMMRPVHARRVVSTVVVDVPERSEGGDV